MKDQLQRLGKRIHELRSAKGWSQEEFAHVAGLHRTYIGQLERGEKNVSFKNLLKLSGVLDLKLAELMAGLEDGSPVAKRKAKAVDSERLTPEQRLFRVERLFTRLSHQRTEMDRTMVALEQLAGADSQKEKPKPEARKARS